MLPHHHQRHKMALMAIILLCCLLTAADSARARDKPNRRERNNAASATSSMSSSPSASLLYGSNMYGSASGSSSSSSSSSYNGPTDSTGFCTRRREMKLMCYCTPDENHMPVQKAECWVFSEGLLQNDTTWTRFYQQKRLRELKFVIQNNARLDYIPTMIIEPLKNLSSVTIEYSQVEIVKSYAFANLQYLERIILNNNHIMALDQDAFSNHIRLRELNLEHNQIFEIDRYAFRNLPLCERLYLNNNNITNLHEGLFADMARLKDLYLAHNQISVLTSEIFRGLGNLNTLKLTKNNLNFIGDTVFAELWSLSELELDDNRIERISERALDGLNNLKTLNLRNNFLKKMDNGLLRGTPALQSLNVQSNELETLTFYTFQPIMDNMVNSSSELLLSDNNFICDCRLQWIYELKNRTHHEQLRDSLEEFVCTLQQPKLANFVDPIPNHILDLLHIGGYSGKVGSSSSQTQSQSQSGNGLSANFNSMDDLTGSTGANAGTGIATGTGRKHSSKSRTGVRAQRQFAVENGVELKKKRKRALQQQLQQQQQAQLYGSDNSDNIHDGMMEAAAAAHTSTATHKRYDYFDEAGIGGAGIGDMGGMSGMGIGNAVNGMDDNLELRNQMSTSTHQYQQHEQYQHNDVLLTHRAHQGGNNLATNALDTLSAKHSLGFKVRLFTLKPEKLPCHDELSDPTELPLSRDLMDVHMRSNLKDADGGAVGHLNAAPSPFALCAGLLLGYGLHNAARRFG